MRMYDIIRRKRDGEALSREEIEFFIRGYVAGEIPDYQASALCMAVFFKGMNRDETVWLTQAMADSGERLDLSCFGDASVDKHSTGGVGDKTSLIIGPIVASLGGKVTKMSGRGLGHTGGTVDKLESIPGYRSSLSMEEFMGQCERVGMAIIGQSGELTPADQKLYALRDVTATVDSIPLITSSVMSKKLAAGSHSIVLDVTVGSGAFMKTPEQAEVLAREMVRIGRACGRNIVAMITNMDSPLGCAIGNALEVKEAISVLRGESQGDLREVCLDLATQMVSLLKQEDEETARLRVTEALDSGKAFDKMCEWIGAQGGDVSYILHPEKFEPAPIQVPVYADRTGWIYAMQAEEIGLTATLLGAGRSKKDDPIDFSAGIILAAKTGEYVKTGDLLCTLHTSRKEAVGEAAEKYLAALDIRAEKPERQPLVYGTIREA